MVALTRLESLGPIDQWCRLTLVVWRPEVARRMPEGTPVEEFRSKSGTQNPEPMRIVIIILVLVVLLGGAVVGYLVLTTPAEALPFQFPLTPAQRELLSRVPPEAEAYALIPAPAVLLGRLEANPITRDAVAGWTKEHPLPPPAMLGGADAVVWKSGKRTSYGVRFDPIRAVIGRVWTMFSQVDARWDGNTLLINSIDQPIHQSVSQGAVPAELDSTTQPGGDVLVVQRTDARGAFPPIGRPALTSVTITTDGLELTSRAPLSRPGAVASTLRPDLPRSAMLAFAFNDPPRVMGDFDRILAADLDALVGEGATIALYGVDTGTLLPRPFAAIAVPSSPRSQQVLERYATVLDGLGQRVDHGGEVVISFDRSSATQYAADTRAPMPWSANRWSMRMDPQRLIPVLRRVGDNTALRFATPRIHRGARDLRRWMGALEQARTIEAAASDVESFEELRVRVSSK